MAKSKGKGKGKGPKRSAIGLSQVRIPKKLSAVAKALLAEPEPEEAPLHLLDEEDIKTAYKRFQRFHTGFRNGAIPPEDLEKALDEHKEDYERSYFVLPPPLTKSMYADEVARDGRKYPSERVAFEARVERMKVAMEAQGGSDCA